jgi:hypothetical protein
MEQYAQFPQALRGDVRNVDIDESEIQSGDFFGVVRFDGLDPMLAWAMGSTTGHTTTALRIDGVLHVCESTAKGSYWPVNGIQCTLWPQWIKQAREAGFNLVHAPLSPENRAKFNETAALEFFQSVNGTDYGYRNMLWGWVDTMKDNYPCVPPTYTTCLEFDHFPIIFGLLEKVAPSLSTLMVTQAWNKRLGSQDLGVSQLLQKAAEDNVPAASIPTIVEQDSWRYKTTRFGQNITGHSMVCCVFVCEMWKAGGLFDDIDNDFQCTEQTNSDDYQLAIFDTNYTRPKVCVDADPNNQLCQLSGNYQLHLNEYNTRTPYKRMGESCPSLAPKYVRTPGC